MPMRWDLTPHMKRKGWTAYRLAKEAGLEPSTVYKLLRAKSIGYVDTVTLEKLAAALSVKNPLALLKHIPD